MASKDENTSAPPPNTSTMASKDENTSAPPPNTSTMASKDENTSAAANEKITLKSSDGRDFAISKSSAALSTLIKKKLSSAKPPEEIDVPFDGATLNLVVTYLNAQDAAGDDEEMKKKADEEFLPAKPEICLLLNVVVAANHLGIQGLEDIVSGKIAERIKNKSLEYVRKAFEIENNITATEEAEIKTQYPWAFEGVEPDDD